ncbi:MULTISPECIES: D-2-hydroxyacid dehydrogenase [Clostridium]|uniref:D-2-hydroxyacid dehydrogenase n=1 Tax=Clostridium cibarium TaxID=2762247 RepID=A0ABR8PWM3_9CLOT|nr:MULTISPECIES: D-2-hydroxyacid dehydrogenase [Clostridium]MBD7912534.1 D-2-hydroxyacid dehydrogenase [Clostridium cibarium]
MIRVLTNDGLEATAIENLKAAGIEVVNEHIDQDKLGEALKEFDALVVRSATKVTKEVLDKEEGGKLKLVVRAGVGIDNIDVVAADEKGVTVKNTPNASSGSVAELALAHMFAVARFVNIANVTMRDGEWNKKKYEGIELSGKTLGIVGMGRIGRSLGAKATALGMKVVYTDLFGKQDSLVYDFLSMEELFKASDFISLHVPYDKTKGSLIGKKEFDLMKDGVYLINCARGKVVNEKALLEALESGKVAGAGVDVFEQEPTLNEALVKHPRVSVTPHIGASTKEAQNRIGEEVVSTIRTFFNI